MRVVRSPQTLHADRQRPDNSKRCESFFDPTHSFNYFYYFQCSIDSCLHHHHYITNQTDIYPVYVTTWVGHVGV